LLYPSSLPDCRPPQKETSRYVFDEDGATLAEIEAQGWSLNPGRYVEVAERKEAEDFDFAQRLEELNEELEILNVEARVLEERIAENVAQILNL
jgi:type I restriction enzyme M protein